MGGGTTITMQMMKMMMNSERSLKFYKTQEIYHCVNGWSLKDLIQVYVYQPKTGGELDRNFPFYTGNLSWCALVPIKFQVILISICPKILFLMCVVILVFATQIYLLYLLQSDLSETGSMKKTIFFLFQR